MTERVLSESILKSAVCELTTVTRTIQGYEVTLPQAYATGDMVSVIVVEERDGFTIHDNSRAAMALDRSGTSRLAQFVETSREAVAYYGCEIDNMRVVRRCTSLEEVALSMVLVGCGSRLIADQAISTERLPIFDFRAKLLDRVAGIVGEKRVRSNELVMGHLGSRYKIAASVVSPDGRRPIAFIEPLSDPSALPRKFKEFYDIGLNEEYADVERVTVIDDSKSFPTGDTLLMQEVSTLVRFSDSGKMFARWGTIQ